MRLNPLHTPEMIADHMRNTGEYIGARRTGRTTAAALGGLAAAIQHPYTPVVVVDHHPTKQASRYLMARMQEIARDLGLEHLYFNVERNEVTFGKR